MLAIACEAIDKFWRFGCWHFSDFGNQANDVRSPR
jgi:hypothetical protein